MGFLMQPAAGQIQAQPFRHQHGLFGGHLADQQRRDFLQVRRGGGFAAQAQGMARPTLDRGRSGGQSGETI